MEAIQNTQVNNQNQENNNSQMHIIYQKPQQNPYSGVIIEENSNKQNSKNSTPSNNANKNLRDSNISINKHYKKKTIIY
jgi:hypothetical protein